MLDGDVDWVGTYDGRMGIPNEGMGMVNLVHTSYLLVISSVPGGAIGGVLLSEQKFVGLQDGRVHGLCQHAIFIAPKF